MTGTTNTTEATGRDSLGGGTSPLLGPIRLGIGLIQGFGVYALQRSADQEAMTWPATQPMLFGPLLLVTAFLPLVLLAGVGRLRLRTLLIWTLVAGTALALLGLHDIARQSAETLRNAPFLSAPVILFTGAALFIAHHLVAPADHERRWIASFPAYFDTAWKAGVQLALSVAFTGVFWILLTLGSALFKVIGLDFLEDLMREDWFWIPVNFVVFAIAVHLTDVRDGLIRGVRTVGLMLLSWLLLVMTVLVAGFLAALPFTGLDGLWETGNATALVLAASGALIVLINTAYQDGRPDNLPPLVLRHAVRVAALLLTPLIVIAVWGLSLRVGQYGLTPDRIIAGACTVVGAIHVGGYAWASLGTLAAGRDWMRPLERTNLIGAIGAVVAILALFSPLLDPARLSVTDQVARLERGAVAADKFDYLFLHFESGKAGQAALARLARSTDATVARLAKAAQAQTNRYDDVIMSDEARVPIIIEMWPAGTALPARFIATGNSDGQLRHCQSGDFCVATRRDLDGDGRPEILLAGRYQIEIYVGSESGDWRRAGFFEPCQPGPRSDARDALKTGKLQPITPRWPDLVFGDGGQRATFRADFRDCTSGTGNSSAMAAADGSGPASR